MGEFRAGAWIIAIMLYFFIFFTLIYSSINAMASMGVTDSRVTMNDPGFQDRFSTFITQPTCGGVSGVMTPFNNFPCALIDVNDDEENCNNVSGCTWKNATNLFNITIFDAKCDGKLNKTFYALNGTTRSNSCQAVSDENTCDLIKCEWLNLTQQAGQSVNLEDSSTLITFWQSVKWIASFDADLGLGGFTFFFVFIFFYIPLMMLLWSIYMAIPFLH